MKTIITILFALVAMGDWQNKKQSYGKTQL